LRTALVALATVTVLGAAAVGGYMFVMGHWFVGVAETADGDEVAVFQGLDASIVGVDLFRMDESTGLATTDLTQAARSRVAGGIDASDRDDAERILSNLRDQRLPPCRAASSTASSPSSTPTDATPAPPSPPADPAATVPPVITPTTTPSPATTSTGQSRSAEPGVDCREAD
jgi:protein phosphatase